MRDTLTDVIFISLTQWKISRSQFVIQKKKKFAKQRSRLMEKTSDRTKLSKLKSFGNWESNLLVCLHFYNSEESVSPWKMYTCRLRQILTCLFSYWVLKEKVLWTIIWMLGKRMENRDGLLRPLIILYTYIIRIYILYTGLGILQVKYLRYNFLDLLHVKFLHGWCVIRDILTTTLNTLICL